MLTSKLSMRSHCNTAKQFCLCESSKKKLLLFQIPSITVYYSECKLMAYFMYQNMQYYQYHVDDIQSYLLFFGEDDKNMCNLTITVSMQSMTCTLILGSVLLSSLPVTKYERKYKINYILP